MRLWLLVGMFFLTGCNIVPPDKFWGTPLTPEELATIDKQNAEAQAKADRQNDEVQTKVESERARNIISHYRPICSQLGFKEGTSDFSNCVLKLYSNDESNKATRNSGGGGGGPSFTQCNKNGNSVNCTSF